MNTNNTCRHAHSWRTDIFAEILVWCSTLCRSDATTAENAFFRMILKNDGRQGLVTDSLGFWLSIQIAARQQKSWHPYQCRYSTGNSHSCPQLRCMWSGQECHTPLQEKMLNLMKTKPFRTGYDKTHTQRANKTLGHEADEHVSWHGSQEKQVSDKSASCNWTSCALLPSKFSYWTWGPPARGQWTVQRSAGIWGCFAWAHIKSDMIQLVFVQALAKTSGPDSPGLRKCNDWDF